MKLSEIPNWVLFIIAVYVSVVELFLVLMYYNPNWDIYTQIEGVILNTGVYWIGFKVLFACWDTMWYTPVNFDNPKWGWNMRNCKMILLIAGLFSSSNPKLPDEYGGCMLWENQW